MMNSSCGVMKMLNGYDSQVNRELYLLKWMKRRGS
jgi:hypothetical protein